MGPDAEKALGHKHILTQVNKKNVSGLLERNNKASLLAHSKGDGTVYLTSLNHLSMYIYIHTYTYKHMSPCRVGTSLSRY